MSRIAEKSAHYGVIKTPDQASVKTPIHGWQVLKLGDVCQLIGGGTPSKAKSEFFNGNIPWATVRDMNSELLELTEHKITATAVKASASNVIPAGNVVIATRVGLGKICLIAQDTAINQDLRGIIPKDQSLDKFFLFWWFKSAAHQIVAAGTGATVQGVKLEFVKNLEIPVPPLEEQERIVKVLDEAFAALDQAKTNLQQNIQNAEQLFQSRLNQIFSQKGDGWEERKLGEITNFIDYRGRTPKKTATGIRLITAKNVRMGYLRTHPEEFIAESDYNSWMTRGIPKLNDVLFTTEAPLANVTLLDTKDRIALAQRIITLSPNQNIIKGEYLSFCLQSKPLQDSILANGTGATVTGIKAKLLKEILVPICSLETQESTVKHLRKYREHIESLSGSYSQQLSHLEELKKSLLQKAFNGEL